MGGRYLHKPRRHTREISPSWDNAVHLRNCD
ncbi:hypothetical protein CGRA01v4_00258 [Colletotrichum graminicola]|nr:hypothetical protein CGRA01v4_00258 [Colletotrichum graminicola]